MLQEKRLQERREWTMRVIAPGFAPAAWTTDKLHVVFPLLHLLKAPALGLYSVDSASFASRAL